MFHCLLMLQTEYLAHLKLDTPNLIVFCKISTIWKIRISTIWKIKISTIWKINKVRRDVTVEAKNWWKPNLENLRSSRHWYVSESFLASQQSNIFWCQEWIAKTITINCLSSFFFFQIIGKNNVERRLLWRCFIFYCYLVHNYCKNTRISLSRSLKCTLKEQATWQRFQQTLAIYWNQNLDTVSIENAIWCTTLLMLWHTGCLAE